MPAAGLLTHLRAITGDLRPGDAGVLLYLHSELREMPR